MGDERVTDVVRERQATILERFRSTDAQQPSAPVNVTNREMGDLLPAQPETKQKQQQCTIPNVPRRRLLARGEELLHLDRGQLPGKTRMLATGDLRQRPIPPVRDRPGVCQIPQYAA